MKLFAGRCRRWGYSAASSSFCFSAFPFLSVMLLQLLLGFCGCFTRLGRDQSFQQPATVTVTGLGFRAEAGVGAQPSVVFWVLALQLHSLPTAVLIMRLSKLQNVLTSGLVAPFWLLSLLLPDSSLRPVRWHWDSHWAGADAAAFKLSEPFCVPAPNSSSCFIWC